MKISGYELKEQDKELHIETGIETIKLTKSFEIYDMSTDYIHITDGELSRLLSFRDTKELSKLLTFMINWQNSK